MNTSDLNLFVRTADSGSITASAKQLGITPAAASAALKRLEKQLDVQLFIRSTRQLRITSEGERFLLYCRQSLFSLEEGKASLNAMRGKIAGEIRLSVSSDLGRNIVLPWLDDALEEHPDLSLQLSIGDNLSDFYMDRVDVALRYGEPEDSSMIAFQIATVNRIAFASPQYLEQYGEPEHPDQLLEHNCLLYRIGSRAYNNWDFYNESERFRVQVQGNRESNDAEIARRWAVAGRGIAYKSVLDVSDDLRTGRVVRLLKDYQTKPVGIWLICPSRKQVTPAILMLRDLLRKKCAEVLSGL
ncbi:LysR family transcriptional regulator [Amphritea balenae]|uniref:LysR family transcriptional regulator n=1 Tax=Amphritea balenae TaxID=452629 RepID=A0A3P1T029_9GAMM|nr:LysR family transcriptional regulator [Amphritea balenae]RRD01743.1 LysR family transcriptional regulator [Amphritea balenae]GGK54430.1 LysR family transcriptional regulator [Amphritea balenae]